MNDKVEHQPRKRGTSKAARWAMYVIAYAVTLLVVLLLLVANDPVGFLGTSGVGVTIPEVLEVGDFWAIYVVFAILGTFVIWLIQYLGDILCVIGNIIGGLVSLSIGLFVILGIVGILVFGFKQIF